MPDQLTLNQIRDRISEMAGIERFSSAAVPGPVTWALKGHNTLHRWDHHPIPTSLDWLVRVWPEGWEWTQYCGDWKAYVAFGQTLDVDGTNNELTDRMSLLLKVLVWLQSNDLPAFTAAINKIRKEVR